MAKFDSNKVSLISGINSMGFPAVHAEDRFTVCYAGVGEVSIGGVSLTSIVLRVASRLKIPGTINLSTGNQSLPFWYEFFKELEKESQCIFWDDVPEDDYRKYLDGGFKIINPGPIVVTPPTA